MQINMDIVILSVYLQINGRSVDVDNLRDAFKETKGTSFNDTVLLALGIPEEYWKDAKDYIYGNAESPLLSKDTCKQDI